MEWESGTSFTSRSPRYAETGKTDLLKSLVIFELFQLFFESWGKLLLHWRRRRRLLQLQELYVRATAPVDDISVTLVQSVRNEISHHQVPHQHAGKRSPARATRRNLVTRRTTPRPLPGGNWVSTCACLSCRTNLQGDQAAKCSRRLGCIEGRTTCVAIVAMCDGDPQPSAPFVPKVKGPDSPICLTLGSHWAHVTRRHVRTRE